MQILTLLLTALPLASAAVFDSIDALPRGWEFHRNAQSSERLNLKISLKEQNLHKFERLFWEIASPGHQNYGKHLEGHQVRDMLQPSEESAGAVVDWLKSNRIHHISIDGSDVSFTTTVGQANALLSTDFNWYKNSARGEARLRTTSYSVPSEVSSHINFVSPTLKFPGIGRLSSDIHNVGSDEAVSTYLEWAASTRDIDAVVPPNSVCSKSITPQCLLGLYNVHYGASANNSKLAYASFLDQYARYADLGIFETSIAPYAAGKNFSVIEFAGGLNDQGSPNSSIEANLDNQYTISVGYPVPVTEFSTAGCGPLIPDPNEAAGSCGNEPYADFLNGILALPNSQLPQTLSISYGEDEQTWPLAEATAVCNNFMKLGARGVSIMFSSGDSGPGAICEDNTGSRSIFTPNFPASCPYVTTVGATQNVAPERVAGFSGGGFSNYFAQPTYQTGAVASYLAKSAGSRFAQYFNKTGRAYPDVAAQGVNFMIVDKGAPTAVGGTSASSPTFAGVVALLNSARASKGIAPLGFLNPFLYRQAAAFNDITVGTSVGCSAGKVINGAGFAATTGWDAATGLGTPDFGKLLAAAAPAACNVGGVIANPSISTCAGAKATTVRMASQTTLVTSAKMRTTTVTGTKPTATSA